jgi:protein-S-isoprenylcysteine O-methyltransferase Ste14
MADREADTPHVRDILVVVLVVQAVFALTAGTLVILDPAQMLERTGTRALAGSLILMTVIVGALLALRFRRRHRAERVRTRAAS